eukprot:1223632-Pleurochrysis_carterae.AAC.1
MSFRLARITRTDAGTRRRFESVGLSELRRVDIEWRNVLSSPSRLLVETAALKARAREQCAWRRLGRGDRHTLREKDLRALVRRAEDVVNRQYVARGATLAVISPLPCVQVAAAVAEAFGKMASAEGDIVGVQRGWQLDEMQGGSGGRATTAVARGTAATIGTVGTVGTVVERAATGKAAAMSEGAVPAPLLVRASQSAATPFGANGAPPFGANGAPPIALRSSKRFPTLSVA